MPADHQHENVIENSIVIHRHSPPDLAQIEIQTIEDAEPPSQLSTGSDLSKVESKPEQSSEAIAATRKTIQRQARALDVNTAPVLSTPAGNRTDEGVDSLPSKLPNNAPPPYPFEAYQAGIEGRVRLEVTIDATGSVVEIRISESSGNAGLDESALTTVRKWKFKPALRLGIAVRHTVIVPVRFSIRDRVQAP